jgi:hypothetical protein
MRLLQRTFSEKKLQNLSYFERKLRHLYITLMEVINKKWDFENIYTTHLQQFLFNVNK